MVGAVAELERGRESYARLAWLDAYGALTAADQAVGRAPRTWSCSLGRHTCSAAMTSTSAAWSGHIKLHLVAGEALRAVRCAFWIGHNMLFRGETVRARGWFARAQRWLERDGRDSVERGWLLIPAWLEQMARGDWEAGYATAAEAAAIGERFGDADLVWLARDEQGRALLGQGTSRTDCGWSTRPW